MRIYERVLMLARKNGGYLRTEDVVRNNIRREVLKQAVQQGRLERVARGIYLIPEVIPDEYKLLQLRCRQGIFSYSTALFLWQLSSTIPEKFDITVPQGYNAEHITRDNQKVVFHYVKPEILELGLTDKVSPFGQKVRVYDRERTICDLLKDKHKIDVQIFSDAMSSYFRSREVNLRRLSKYARALHVEEILRLYTEVLL